MGGVLDTGMRLGEGLLRPLEGEEAKAITWRCAPGIQMDTNPLPLLADAPTYREETYLASSQTEFNFFNGWLNLQKCREIHRAGCEKTSKNA